MTAYWGLAIIVRWLRPDDAPQVPQPKPAKFNIPFMWASFSTVYHNRSVAVDGDRGFSWMGTRDFYRAIVDQLLRHEICTYGLGFQVL